VKTVPAKHDAARILRIPPRSAQSAQQRGVSFLDHTP
jgi:hypothetical protein